MAQISLEAAVLLHRDQCCLSTDFCSLVPALREVLAVRRPAEDDVVRVS